MQRVTRTTAQFPRVISRLENGKTYDMTFSFCQISANQLRVVLKVDGKEWIQ